jgi:aspartyl-tRNA(Asn)/glutamyl-tRNA(Gln) amidotransferase subunit A
VTGFKPTYGAIPANGIVWLSWTMDHVGVLAGSMGDAAALVSAAAPDFGGLADSAREPAGWRVGVPRAGFDGASGEVERGVRGAIDQLAEAGVVIVPLDAPSDDDFRLANAAGLIISRAEALSYHRSLGTDISLLWPETADQLRMAESITATEYLDAQRFRRDLAGRMQALVEEHDLAALAMPATLVTAPLVSEAERYFTLLSRNAIPWSLIGWPAASIPCRMPPGSLPAGLQLVAPPFEDATLVSLGGAFQRE